MGPTLVSVARAHAGATANALIQEISVAPRSDRPAIGLLLARVLLDEALATRSTSKLNDFLFRLGAHFQSSVNVPGVTTEAKQVLVGAADLVFNNLPTATARHFDAIRSMKSRIGVAGRDESLWRTTIGLTSTEFTEYIELIGTTVRPMRTWGLTAATSAQNRPTDSVATSSSMEDRPSKSDARVPTWLMSLPSADQLDELVASGRNWKPVSGEVSTPWNPTAAWLAFINRDFETARSAIAPLMAGVGSLWGPNSTADHLRLWHWVRLVVELSSLHGGTVSNRRRSATSCFGLAIRCVPDDDDLCQHLLSTALEDFVAEDIVSKDAWGAYTIRLVEASDHERALVLYDNSEKAQLRQIWAARHDLSAEENRNTAVSSNTLVSRLRRAQGSLHAGARQGGNTFNLLRAARRDLDGFVDEGERSLLSSAASAVELINNVMTSEAPSYEELEECIFSLREAGAAISLSGSLMLQDYVAPLVAMNLDIARIAKSRLEDTSRPNVAVRLESTRLPLSAAPGTAYDVRFILSNEGNATAEDIAVRLSGPSMGVSITVTLPSLGAGSEETLIGECFAIGHSPQGGQLSCSWTWTDALSQSFSSSTAFAVEDQRKASWTLTDVNPFSLGTISDPSRLVGRDDDLASLEALLAGGGSAYITGHKRVGKTSLTRVLLQQTKSRRGWAGEILPLGRAFGPEQSAGDLVYAMMDEILGALHDAYDDLDGLSEIEPDPQGNFARASNRWLRKAFKLLPNDARMVLAIDDFDELPSHLLSGSQADALFLFLRTLVDESWLNLVLVGSEILPTVIASQSHKLNQVVPVSVTNFSSRASSEALLVTPTINRLEWDGAAVDRAHSLCQGSPYYETLVAQQVWIDLREKRRSFVTPADINAAANVVAAEAPASHFVHLWADSALGIDHTSRRAIVTSSVLRAVARCGGDKLAPAQVDEVIRVAQTWIQSAPEHELNQVINTLTNRNVLERGPSESTVVMSIPLVATWLGQAGSIALDADYAGSNHANATARVVTESDLAGLSRGLTYRGEHISEIRIKAWLQQFGDNYHQHLAYQMLRRMIPDGYFSITRMHDRAMPKLREAVLKSSSARQIARDSSGYMRNAFLVKHGASGDSTQGTISALCKTLKVKKANVLSLEDTEHKLKIPDSGVVLFVLDDFSGSGKHLVDTVGKVIDRLDANDKDWVERVHLVAGAAVVVDESRLPVTDREDVDLTQVSGLVLGSRFRAFHPESDVFDSTKEREDAEQLTITVGRALVPNSPLGFGDDALLSLLEFNCPNNVAPIFWKRGNYAGRDWYPLFERAL